MVVEQGEIWWAELPEPIGSGPGYRRPVIVVQGDSLNRSRIATAICVPLTTNLKWGSAPGNVRIKAAMSGLPEDSVANVSAIFTIDKSLLCERVRKLAPANVRSILSGIDIVLGR